MRLLPVLVIIALGALLMWSAVPAHAMGMCGKREDFVKALANAYGESSKALGIAGRVNIVEVFNSGDGGTWTVLVTTPEGKSCILAAGSDWQELPPPKPIVRGKDS